MTTNQLRRRVDDFAGRTSAPPTVPVRVRGDRIALSTDTAQDRLPAAKYQQVVADRFAVWQEVTATAAA
jgi:hypothetical protein